MSDKSGIFESPGGQVFGIQGWNWGDPKPKGITFFLDGTAKVTDQHGRPIPGNLNPETNKKVLFALRPPTEGDTDEYRKKFATHEQVIKALEEEKIDWRKLHLAGWPQLRYDKLKTVPNLIPVDVLLSDENLDAFITELRKIRDTSLRKDALRYVREVYEERQKELQQEDEG